VSDNSPTRSHEESLYEAALHLKTPDERRAFLSLACAQDPELQRRIEELLSAAEVADAFFAQDPVKNAGMEAKGLLATVPEAPVTEKPGERIGRYRLLQKIGEGGCGVVYMAEQEEPVRRRVALKVIKLGMDTRSVVARFEAERQALALMDHPNIAKVHDAGATETGRPYFVMELVRGVKITEYCDEKNLSTKERLELFVKVCQAVQHAHQKGIIHRDLKPSNILVTVNDGVAVPKVIDFGVAKATTDQRLTDKTVFTAFEQFIGTPAYMSPEQAEITSVDVDTRSDIYSLGVLLYELLTGQTPFDAKELLKVGLDEMRRTIREREPDRPSTRVSTLGGEQLTTTAKRRGLDAPKLVNVLRGDLDWIVMKCLEKDRARRYETANGLAMDIQRHLSNEPVVACPPSRVYRLQKMVRRNQGVFAAAAVILVLLVGGAGISTLEAFRARQAEKKARNEAAKSNRVAHFFEEMLQGVGPSVSLGRDTTVLAEILDKASSRLSTELSDEPEAEIFLTGAVAGVYQQLQQFTKAEEMMRASLELGKRVYGDHNPAIVSIIVNLTWVLFSERRYSEAEQTAQEALAIIRSVPASKQTQRALAETLAALGKTYRYEDKKVEAVNALREALDIKRKLLGSTNLEVAYALNDLANAVREQGNPVEAEPMFRESLKILDQNHVPEIDLSRAGILCNLARACQLQGKLREAEEAARACASIFRNVVKAAGDRPDLHLAMNEYHANYFGGLGEVLLAEGKLDEAAGLQREALMSLEKAARALSEAKQARDDPDILWARGNVFARLGRSKEAAADLMKVRELRPSQLLCWHNLAAVLVQTGDTDAYREHCRLALERFANTTDPVMAERIAKDCLILPSSGADLATVASLADMAVRLGNASGLASWHLCKGFVEYRQGHFAAAAEWMQRTLADPRDPKMPIGHSSTGKEDPARDAEAYAVLAMAQYSLNQVSEARVNLANARETIDKRLPKVGRSDPGAWYVDWIIAHALLREAQELLDVQPQDDTVQGQARKLSGAQSNFDKSRAGVQGKAKIVPGGQDSTAGSEGGPK
jgi:tetratricopeptide (TPR) repeat protein